MKITIPACVRLTALSSALLLAGCMGDSADSLVEKAKEAVAKQDSKAASIFLKNALEKDAKNAEARFLLGRALLEIGDFGGALIELRKAAELGFDAQELAPLLAYAMLINGEAKRVVSDYADFKASTVPANAAIKATLASAYLFLGNSEAAMVAADQALAASPNYAQAYLVKVKIYATNRKFDEALDLIDRVLVINQKLPEAYLLRGDILKASKGDLQGAEAAYEGALKVNERYMNAHMALIGLALGRNDVKQAQTRMAALNAAAPKNPATFFIAAVVAFESGDLKAAQEKTQQVLKFSPGNPRALQLLGAIELRRGSLVQAETALTKAAAELPDDPHVHLLLARTLLRSGSYDKALKILRPLADRPKPSFDAVSLTAEGLLLSGQADQAQEYFARAAKLNPSDSRSRTILAVSQAIGGRGDQDVLELRSIASTDEGAFSDLALINLLLTRKKYPEALEAIGKLEKKQPTSAVGPSLRANMALERGDRKAARAAFDAALKLEPTYYPAVAHSARLDIAEGKLKDAKERLEGFIAKTPSSVPAQLFLISIREQEGVDSKAVMESLRQLIRNAPTEPRPRILLTQMQIRERDISGALSTAQEGVATIGETVDMSDNLGQIQIAAGDMNLAISTYAKLAKNQPTSPVPHMRMAEIFANQKNPTGAIQSLRRAIAVSPDLAPALQMLMVMELNAGQGKEALAVAKSAQEKFKSSPFGHALEGDMWAAQRNWDAAAAAYRRGLDVKGSPELAIRLHRVLVRLPQATRADDFQRQWLGQHAEDAVFRMYLASEAVKRSDFAQASTYYEAIVKADPSNVEALNNQAWALTKAGKPGALETIRQAIAIAPKEASLYDTQADIYAAANDLPKAVEAQKTAVSLKPNWHEARLRLAKLYLKQGDKGRARQELEPLQRLGEKHPLYLEVQKARAAAA